MKKLLNRLSGALALLSLVVSSAHAQGGQPILNIPQPGTVSVTSIGSVIAGVIGILIIVAAILAFLFLILGGLQWITSGGDKAGMEAARNKITAAIVGLIIVAAAWAVMFLVGQFIGFNILGNNINIPTINHPGP